MACRCSDWPSTSGRSPAPGPSSLALITTRSKYSVMPSAARSGSRSNPAPNASAASARCTAVSCNRRRIHHCAGRGPRNVHTGVWGPVAFTASSSAGTPAWPRDFGVLASRGLAAGNRSRIDVIAGSLGHDVSTPPVAASDVDHQLAQRPARAGRDREGKVGIGKQVGEGGVLGDQRSGGIHSGKPTRRSALNGRAASRATAGFAMYSTVICPNSMPMPTQILMRPIRTLKSVPIQARKPILKPPEPAGW